MIDRVIHWMLHPIGFQVALLSLHIGVFATIERLWRDRPIAWRKVLVGDAVALVFCSFAVVYAARQLNSLVDLRGPWPAMFEQLPFAARLAIYLLVADFGAYWMHRLVHIKILWRVHRWHHAPRHMYWLAGVRGSVLQQTIFNVPYIVASPLIDVSPWWLANGLLIFYTMTNSWMHMNVRWRLPWLELALVTPGSHHIHHSDNPEHYNSNFGVILSVWDRLFGTYTSPRQVDSSAIRFGIGEQVPVARMAIGI